MILAAIDDTGYNIILLLHILTAMAAFVPVFVHPALLDPSRSMSAEASSALWGAFAANGRKIYAPALILTGILGFGVVGMSDEFYSMGDGWVIAAILVWIAQNGVVHALVAPGEKAWSSGATDAAKKIATGSAALGALLVVQLVLMVFKPGA